MQFREIGLFDYKAALELQLSLVEDVAEKKANDTVLFCTHPPVVTLGRATQPDDILDWQGEMVEVSRGGRATYHGPDQLVIYPIINLNSRGRDLHAYLRVLELIIINVLERYGVQAQVIPGATGVWVADRKIASIGIAVKKWVTYHGISLAVDQDPNAYKGIQPCGFSPSVMTNLEALIGEKIDRNVLISYFKRAFELLLPKINSTELNSQADIGLPKAF